MDTPLQPADSYVERLWNELGDLQPYVTAAGPAVSSNMNSAFAKAMILAAGNWLERRTVQMLREFAKSASNRASLAELVRIRVLDRKFHTLFNWRSGRVDSFLGSFGADFKKRVEDAARENEDVGRASKDFMELVGERNGLAHNERIGDEAQFTPLEVRNKFYNAAGWVSWIGRFLAEDGPPSWRPPVPPSTGGA